MMLLADLNVNQTLMFQFYLFAFLQPTLIFFNILLLPSSTLLHNFPPISAYCGWSADHGEAPQHPHLNNHFTLILWNNSVVKDKQEDTSFFFFPKKQERNPSATCYLRAAAKSHRASSPCFLDISSSSPTSSSVTSDPVVYSSSSDRRVCCLCEGEGHTYYTWPLSYCEDAVSLVFKWSQLKG